jgi:ABC-2 type transport system permease protein
MTSTEFAVTGSPSLDRLAYHLRVLRVIATIEFKLKYAGSVLGYVWSIAKPLSYFAVLWVVFGRVFKTGIENFPVYLLTGIVLYTFLVDATGLALTGIANRGLLLRRLAFPPIIIPVSVSVTAFMTFAINSLVLLALALASGVFPSLDWLLILPLLAELYLFILGIGFVLTTLFVRFRDVLQLWELGTQLLLFAAPIMYPVSFLPSWAQRIAFLNPFVQIIQDIRYVMIGPTDVGKTASSVLGGAIGHMIPIAIALAVFVVGLAIFQRDAPRLAEKV